MILTLSDIKISVDFENLLPKLTSEQFTQLEKNMVDEGRARNPLVIWKGKDILVDGHNRLRVLKAHPELKWHSTEIEFADEDEAKEWIIKTAIGTRNLTANQFQELLGRYQKMRKGRRGAPKGNANAKKQKSEKPTFVSGDIASATAQEFGVHRDTVYAAENFVDGLDAIEAVIPGAAEEIRSGNLPYQKAEVRGARKQTPEEIKAVYSRVKDRGGKKNKSTVSENRELFKKINNYSAEIASVPQTKYGLAELLREIDALGDSFILSLDSMIKRRANVVESYDGGADKVFEHLDMITAKIEDTKKGIKNE